MIEDSVKRCTCPQIKLNDLLRTKVYSWEYRWGPKVGRASLGIRSSIWIRGSRSWECFSTASLQSDVELSSILSSADQSIWWTTRPLHRWVWQLHGCMWLIASKIAALQFNYESVDKVKANDNTRILCIILNSV